MRIGFATASLMMAATAGLSIPAPALALDPEQQDHRWQGDQDGNWDPARHYRTDDERHAREMSENDRVYRGSDGRYYCKRSDGTTGLIVGGVAGGVLGNIIAGGTLGTLLGAGGGALLGRSIDKRKSAAKCE